MQTNGTDTIWFHYDATGSPISFELNGTPYYYVKNLQGDITMIVDSSGSYAVEYSYDSWGRMISTVGPLANTVGVKNPFRYRGYYYDTEIGLYYLNSRYYDPITKRFINADGYAATGQGILGNNMFAYCGDNPINYVDLTGYAHVAALNGHPDSAILGSFGGSYGNGFSIVYVIIQLIEAVLSPTATTTAPPISTALQISGSKTVTKDKAKEKGKTITVPKLPRKDHIHHIVAQNATRAEPARNILEKVGINHLTDPANLVQLPAYYHQRLHTYAYYDYVNDAIITAYETDGREGVYSALAVLKWEISTGAIW